MGLRNLYKVFNETRKAARERATLAVTGDSPAAAEARGPARRPEERRGGRGDPHRLGGPGSTLSGKAVEDPGEIPPACRTRRL